MVHTGNICSDVQGAWTSLRSVNKSILSTKKIQIRKYVNYLCSSFEECSWQDSDNVLEKNLVTIQENSFKMVLKTYHALVEISVSFKDSFQNVRNGRYEQDQLVPVGADQILTIHD